MGNMNQKGTCIDRTGESIVMRNGLRATIIECRKAVQKSSKYKGVSFHKRQCQWTANIRYTNKLYHLGSFDYEIDAAKAYNQAAIKYYGEFALLNKFD